ncbi:hypothetical protein [Streptomyces yaizuensis]|uniref:Secreted protein n=1 Tax=Streptomyces yaizuensis TaxID=2989713 RepID=A0ABQ5P3Z1_9ACTN|nr:hypothetical protein [Streptomyces sp. YSPA8]GLF97205.1 hypothetical protein SYYSPA8_22930 [Streptomyces sp. YSPA8]
MRRLAVTLATLAAAATLTVAVPTSAHAANGVLVVNEQVVPQPSGCYASEWAPLFVSNYTDEPVFILSGPDCDGELIDVVWPGDSTISEFGGSVYVN